MGGERGPSGVLLRGAVPLLVIVVFAAGCTAHHDESAVSSSTTPSVAPRPSPSKAPTESGRAAAIPTKVANNPADRSAVTLSRCAGDSSGAHVGGTVTNPGARSATYTVTVFFTTATATVVNYATTQVHAKPGTATAWSINQKFRAPQGMRCVLRGVSTK